MKNIAKKIEVASNVAIILIAFLLGGFIVSRFVTKAVPQSAAVANKEIVSFERTYLARAGIRASELPESGGRRTFLKKSNRGR